MTEDEQLVPNLWKVIQESRGVPELLRVLDQIDLYRQREDLGQPDCLRLLRMGLGAAQGMMLDDVAAAQSVIADRLVPLVLQSAPESDTRTAIELSNLRKLLADWIESIPDGPQEGVRQHVLRVLADAVDGGEFRPACWTIAEIGYRDEHIVERLWSIVEAEDDRRGTALSTIVALGVPDGSRQRVLRILESELQDGFPKRIRYAVQELTALETAGPLLRFVEKEPGGEKESLMDLHVTQSILNRILDASWSAEEFQRDVWTRLTRIADARASAGQREFDLRPGVGPHCNTSQAVPYYLSALAEAAQAGGGAAHPSWPSLSRLNECIRPMHTKGWREAADRRDFVQVLGQVAQQDTKHNIGVVTTESRMKKDAWNHLLSLSATQAVELVENAVANETSPHVQNDVLECAACLAIPRLPPSVKRLITEEFDFQPDTDLGQFIARIGATAFARSSATPEAFKTLLDFGLTDQGAVLLNSLNAIGRVAVALVKRGETGIPAMLQAMALGASTIRRREGAVAGLYGLARAGQLGSESVAPLMIVVRDGSLPVFVRDQALETAGFLPKEAFDSEQLAYVIRLAHGGEGIQDSSQWRATELLIQHDLLPGDKCGDLLEERLKLRRSGDSWLLDDSQPIDQWQGFSIAMLWRKHPATFAEAVAEVIRHAEMFKITPTLGVISLGPAQVANEVNEVVPVVDALVDRIKANMTKAVAELELFRPLRCLDPQRFVTEPWDRHWQNWMPEAQAMFADESAQVKFKELSSVARAVSLLTALIGEGPYAVRRSACRAMSRISPEALEVYCRQWAEGSVDERRRAAEAAGWSHEEGNGSPEPRVLATLLVDPDRTVRETARRVAHERRNRRWADAYLDRVLSVRGAGNEEVLQNYCYGQSLARTGDDDHQRRLQEHLETTELPPHVQHWLRRLLDGVEKQWQGVTKKWPEPWMSWGGTVEEVDGQLLFDNVPVEVHFSLWRKERTALSDLTSWGAVVRSSSIGFQRAFVSSGFLTLRIPGRRDATAILGHATFSSHVESVVVLHGSGPYPDLEPSSEPRA